MMRKYLLILLSVLTLSIAPCFSATSWDFLDTAGVLFEAGGSGDPDGFIFTLAAEFYGLDFLSAYGGFSIVGSDELSDDFPAMFGLAAGLRLTYPARFSPFVGMGIWGGYASHSESVNAEYDDIDNDDDGWIDERGEKKRIITNSDAAASFYPEAGVHIWLREELRLSLSAKYFLLSSGREDDFWLYGFSLLFAM